MKLSNLSLAILIGLGVAACGGSDDNNQTQDPPPPGGNNGGGDTTPPPADNSQKPQDPARTAPDLSVQPGVADLVQARKVTYANKGARDMLTGYAPNEGIVAAGIDPWTGVELLFVDHDNNPDTPEVPDMWDHDGDPNTPDVQRSRNHGLGVNYIDDSTKDADVKRLSSRVNYSETGQFYRNANTNPAHNGAVIANPGFTYAEGKDGKWYLVKPAGNVAWDMTEPDTKYVTVEATTEAQFPQAGVGQSKLFFIPNAAIDGMIGAATTGTTGTMGADNKPKGKNVIDPKAPADFDLTRGVVHFTTAEFLGDKYEIDAAGKISKIDLNKIAVKKELQYLPVKVNYNIDDDKSTAILGDDALKSKSADAGAMKAYNLPYSLAFVTVNQAGAEKGHYDDAGARARNLFDYSMEGVAGDWGPYQVVGYQSPYLPRNGRADYVGKSFGVDSQGDIHLRADFGATGSHISGSVINRTRADGKTELANINLANIQLSTPGNLNTTGTTGFGNAAAPGRATAGASAGVWHVQLFGPDAEEAGGAIAIANHDVIPGFLEVFTSQRGVITQDSNIAPTP